MEKPLESWAPLTVAVYVVEPAKGALGVKVAVLVDELYERVAATAVPAEFLRVKPMVLWVTGSSKVAETVDDTPIPVDPGVGDSRITAGFTGLAISTWI